MFNVTGSSVSPTTAEPPLWGMLDSAIVVVDAVVPGEAVVAVVSLSVAGVHAATRRTNTASRRAGVRRVSIVFDRDQPIERNCPSGCQKPRQRERGDGEQDRKSDRKAIEVLLDHS